MSLDHQNDGVGQGLGVRLGRVPVAGRWQEPVGNREGAGGFTTVLFSPGRQPSSDARDQESHYEGWEKPLTHGSKQARKRGAALIKQVYEVDPLSCPKCGAEMKTCPP